MRCHAIETGTPLTLASPLALIALSETSKFTAPPLTDNPARQPVRFEVEDAAFAADRHLFELQVLQMGNLIWNAD